MSEMSEMPDKKFYVQNGGIKKIYLAKNDVVAAQILTLEIVANSDEGGEVGFSKRRQHYPGGFFEPLDSLLIHLG